MLSPEQANQIGTELVAQAKSQRISEKNARARRISLLYRFPEFESFEAWERPALLLEARTTVMKKPLLIALWVFFSVLAFCIIFYSVKFEPVGKLPAPFYWMSTAIFMSPAFLYRRALIQRHVRDKALERKG